VRRVAAAGAEHKVAVTRLRVGLEEVVSVDDEPYDGPAAAQGGRSLPFPSPDQRRTRPR
jgi:hypothetical protein